MGYQNVETIMMIPLSPFMTTHIREPTHLSISSDKSISIPHSMAAQKKLHRPKGRSWEAIIKWSRLSTSRCFKDAVALLYLSSLTLSYLSVEVIYGF